MCAVEDFSCYTGAFAYELRNQTIFLAWFSSAMDPKTGKYFLVGFLLCCVGVLYMWLISGEMSTRRADLQTRPGFHLPNICLGKTFFN